MDTRDENLGCEQGNEEHAVFIAPDISDTPTDDETLITPPLIRPKRSKKFKPNRDMQLTRGRTRGKTRTSEPLNKNYEYKANVVTTTKNEAKNYKDVSTVTR
jgi:hypothetical protein